jgi:hypothetical protein
MKQWVVTVPITAKAFVEVDAESREDAIEKALDAVELDNVEEWEPHKIISEGNFFHGTINEIEAEEEGA